jgi:dipeptidyl aminopeptidase/acylaminoacyl peptidase
MRWAPLLLALGLAAGGRAGLSASALPGTLAYVKNGTPCVAPAAGGAARPVPGSRGAVLTSLSPSGAALLFFLPRGKDGSSRGYISRKPYARSQPLPAPLDRVTSPQVVWTPEGGTAFVTAAIEGPDEQRETYSYSLTGGRVRTESSIVDSASRDGKVTAYADYEALVLHPGGSKGAEIVTSNDERAAVLAAVRTARRPAGLSRLRAALKEASGSGQTWAVSPPAVSPDGQAVYFACNAGAPMGASGGTTYAFFVRNVATGKVAALSGLGDFESLRMPEVCRVSPDGKRLLFVSTAHGSAIQNTRHLYLVDLPTQRSREVLARGYTEWDSNLIDGEPCWSADGRYVAADVFSYRIDSETNAFRVRKPEGGWGKTIEPDALKLTDRDYAVLIFDAGTGREVRRIPGAACPSWSR